MNIVKIIVSLLLLLTANLIAEEVSIYYNSAVWTTTNPLSEPLKELKEKGLTPNLWENEISNPLFWNITCSPGNYPSVNKGENWPKDFIIHSNEHDMKGFGILITLHSLGSPAEIRLITGLDEGFNYYSRSTLAFPEVLTKPTEKGWRDIVLQPSGQKNWAKVLDIPVGESKDYTWKDIKDRVLALGIHPKVQEEILKNAKDHTEVYVVYLPIPDPLKGK